MMDSDDEIEYLDEDAEIVQHLVQAQTPETEPVLYVQEKASLLVQRPAKKKRKKEQESDDDYDPSQDMVPSPPSPKTKKRKLNTSKKSYKNERNVTTTPTTDLLNVKKVNFRKVLRENRLLSGSEEFALLKKLNVKIPDYDDPLCLPVKAIQNDSYDVKRLQTWNNVCLEHFKHYETMLKPENGETRSSVRTLVFQNVASKSTGKTETSIWSKTSVANEDGEKKSEIFQCILPKYKEKKTLNPNNFTLKKGKSFRTVSEVVLAKENHENSEVLIAYKPKLGISSIFTMVDKRKKSEQETDETNPNEEKSNDKNSKGVEDVKLYLKGIACCRVCVHCFNKSWRGVKKNRDAVTCPMCARPFASLHQLLAHIQLHPRAEVQRYKRVISLALSEYVDYHYKCRMCREKRMTIKDMKQHVSTHQGTETFICEVGSHSSR